jgi:hypothetical protein
VAHKKQQRAALLFLPVVCPLKTQKKIKKARFGGGCSLPAGALVKHLSKRGIIMQTYNAVLFGGSRSLPWSKSSWVTSTVAQLIASGGQVVTGCATGADAQVISAACYGRQDWPLSVFAAFGPNGAGSWSASNVADVQKAARSGASVSWLAGGSLAVPLVGRLMRRSQAAVRASAACVFFLASPTSPGSLAVAGYAIGRGLPVFAFALGGQGFNTSFSVPAFVPQDPRGQVGMWVSSSFYGLPCWRWNPTQETLL